MTKSLFAVVLLAAGVSFATAQTTDKTKKVKAEKAAKTEVKAEVNADAAVALPVETLEVKAADDAAVKTETAAELKQEEVAKPTPKNRNPCKE